MKLRKKAASLSWRERLTEGFLGQCLDVRSLQVPQLLPQTFQIKQEQITYPQPGPPQDLRVPALCPTTATDRSTFQAIVGAKFPTSYHMLLEKETKLCQ